VLAADPAWIASIESAADLLARQLDAGHLVIACGNGGSMTDAMHLAGELSGRYRLDRQPFKAVAVSDPCHITAVANDYGFEYVFSRAVEAWGAAGDVLVAISTSGTSPNVCRAAESARARGISVIGLTGRADTRLAELSDVEVCARTDRWADRAQEVHGVALHLITAGLERRCRT
jgi:D-sedoheptulose 7-phosphate isomerase